MQRPKEARSGIAGKEIEECCLTWVTATRQAADGQHRHFLVTALILFIMCFLVTALMLFIMCHKGMKGHELVSE